MMNIMEQPKDHRQEGVDKNPALKEEFQKNRKRMDELVDELERLEVRNREIYPEITGAPKFKQLTPEEGEGLNKAEEKENKS